MNKKQSTRSKFAFFLLRKLYRSANRDPLMGDLLEQASERRSNAWLWREVLVAVRTVAFSHLRGILPEIYVFVAAVAIVCGFPWGLILPLESMDNLNGIPRIPAMLGVEGLTVLLVWPVFTALLIARKAFTWVHSLQISAIIFLLFSGADLLLRQWAVHHDAQSSASATALFVRLQVLCIATVLLLSTVVARRLSLRRKFANHDV
jgi:hypothetical protein